jgi:RteC protein.
MKKIVAFIESVYDQLKDIESREEMSLANASNAITVLEDSFDKVKGLISTYTFKDDFEEIHFFKVTKPQLFSKLIYYQKVVRIEASRPAGSNTAIKTYLTRELDKIQCYFERNIDFYKYYRNGYTHFDNYYFLRGKPDIQLTLDSFYFERDPKFSTCYDFTVAKVIANDMLTVYINNELVKLDKQPEEEQMTGSFPKVKETWTGSKTDMVELLYALWEFGCFNYGNISLIRLTGYLENVFNISLGDVYRTYLSIRGRANRTQFLDQLKDKLVAKMNKDDQK